MLADASPVRNCGYQSCGQSGYLGPKKVVTKRRTHKRRVHDSKNDEGPSAEVILDTAMTNCAAKAKLLTLQRSAFPELVFWTRH